MDWDRGWWDEFQHTNAYVDCLPSLAKRAVSKTQGAQKGCHIVGLRFSQWIDQGRAPHCDPSGMPEYQALCREIGRNPYDRSGLGSWSLNGIEETIKEEPEDTKPVGSHEEAMARQASSSVMAARGAAAEGIEEAMAEQPGMLERRESQIPPREELEAGR